MNDEKYDEMASAFEAPADLGPWLTELVQDMWALGSSPGTVVELLSPLGLPPDDTHMLDLGCGKGAVSVTLARDLGYRATGVDLCEPFLEVARQKAAEHGVAGLCEFERDDLRRFLGRAGGYDIVILISLGATLGPFDETVGSLRNAVKTGGYIIIDDGYLNSGSNLDRRRRRHYAQHAKTLELLTSHGDTIVTERIYTREEKRAINDLYIASISKKGAQIVGENPGLAGSMARYIKSQVEECEIIDRHITGAMWLIRKS